MELGFNAIRYNFSYSGRFFGYSFLHPLKTSTKKKNLAITSINKIEDTVNLQIIIRTELGFTLQVQLFVRSGYVYLPSRNNSTLLGAGINSYDWSARASSTSASGATTPSAYNLHFGPTGVYPSYGPWERHYGRPLRCLSTVLGM